MLGVEKTVGRGEERAPVEKEQYDAIVIGSGIGGLVAATQLAVKGARILVLEKYVIPGGSSGFFERDGFTFDVGSSVMFGFSDKVSTSSLLEIEFIFFFFLKFLKADGFLVFLLWLVCVVICCLVYVKLKLFCFFGWYEGLCL